MQTNAPSVGNTLWIPASIVASGSQMSMHVFNERLQNMAVAGKSSPRKNSQEDQTQISRTVTAFSRGGASPTRDHRNMAAHLPHPYCQWPRKPLGQVRAEENRNEVSIIWNHHITHVTTDHSTRHQRQSRIQPISALLPRGQEKAR